ncbi:MAG: recombination mediator RecR [Flavobacteriales bacterium]
MSILSKHIEAAVEQVGGLPGIGKKTALRLVLHLLRRKPEDVEKFSLAISRMKENVRNCIICNTLTDHETCGICSSPYRDNTQVCVVADIRDVMALEATEQFKGRYHVLGGVISPLDGVGPSDLEISSLVKRVHEGQINEVILALTPSMEGDTTSFYIFRKLEPSRVKITVLARGVAVGGELEYTDEVTLGRSVIQRTPYVPSLMK